MENSTQECPNKHETIKALVDEVLTRELPRMTEVHGPWTAGDLDRYFSDGVKAYTLLQPRPKFQGLKLAVLRRVHEPLKQRIFSVGHSTVEVIQEADKQTLKTIDLELGDIDLRLKEMSLPLYKIHKKILEGRDSLLELKSDTLFLHQGNDKYFYGKFEALQAILSAERKSLCESVEKSTGVEMPYRDLYQVGFDPLNPFDVEGGLGHWTEGEIQLMWEGFISVFANRVQELAMMRNLYDW